MLLADQHPACAEFEAQVRLLRADVEALFGRPCAAIAPVPALFRTMRDQWQKTSAYFPEHTAQRIMHQRLVERMAHYTPEMLDTVEAIMYSYAECEAWRRVTKDEFFQLPRALDEERAAALYERRMAAIENLKTQIAPYYTQRLMDQGHTLADSMAIVGNGVRAFLDVSKAAYPREPRPTVMPAYSGECKQKMWRAMVDCAREAARDAADDRSRC